MGIEKFEGKKAFGWYHFHNQECFQMFVFEEEADAARWFPVGCKDCKVIYKNGQWVLDGEIEEPVDLVPAKKCTSCRSADQIWAEEVND